MIMFQKTYGYYVFVVDDDTFNDLDVGDKFKGGVVVDGVCDEGNDEQGLIIIRKETEWENSAGKKESGESDK